jgi:hypothetical protein
MFDFSPNSLLWHRKRTCNIEAASNTSHFQVFHFCVDDSQELALYHDVVRWDFLKRTALVFVFATSNTTEPDAFGVRELFVVKPRVANDVSPTLYDKAYGSQFEYANSVHVACM